MEKQLTEYELNLLHPSYRDIFSNDTCGRPEDISPHGVSELLKKGFEAWNQWRLDYPENKKISFPQLPNNIETPIDFSKFNFPNIAFVNVHFVKAVSFERAIFEGNVTFEECVFYDDVNFFQAEFKGEADFKGVVFNPKSKLNFAEVVFEKDLDLSSIDFELWKLKRNSIGDKGKRDDNFMFLITLNLNSEVLPNSNFSKATFYQNAKFNGRIFKAQANFENADFKKVPEFFGAKIHPKTWIENAKFPNSIVTKGQYINEYRVLKLAFAEHKNTRQELRFLRREMMEEMWISSSSHRMWLKIYQFISDFGFSVCRPLLGLLLLALIALMFYLWISSLNGKWFLVPFDEDLEKYFLSVDWGKTLNYIGFSLSNSLPFLSSAKFDEKLIVSLFGSGVNVQIVKSFVVFQQSISFLFWFLIGLAIRNKFKLK